MLGKTNKNISWALSSIHIQTSFSKDELNKLDAPQYFNFDVQCVLMKVLVKPNSKQSFKSKRHCGEQKYTKKSTISSLIFTAHCTSSTATPYGYLVARQKNIKSQEQG